MQLRYERRCGSKLQKSRHLAFKVGKWRCAHALPSGKMASPCSKQGEKLTRDNYRHWKLVQSFLMQVKVNHVQLMALGWSLYTSQSSTSASRHGSKRHVPWERRLLGEHRRTRINEKGQGGHDGDRRYIGQGIKKDRWQYRTRRPRRRRQFPVP